MGLQRRGGSGGSGDGSSTLDLSCTLNASLPNVVEFLTLDAWPDGKRREHGTVMLVCDDGLYKAWLHDKDAGMSAWVSSESLQDLWERVDAILGGAGHEWRRDRGSKKK